MIITILKAKILETACDHLDSIFSLQANSECTASNQQTDASFFCLSALLLKIK